jgi:CheY-like chemotaxis protein
MNEQHHPRLILMDLQMPRLDGFAAAAEINRNAGEETPVIVAVTANAGADVRAACRAAGFAGVLAKPVVIEELIATVRHHLRDA